MYQRFNNATINGTVIAPKDMIEGGGDVVIDQGVERKTTLDHRIRRVIVAEKGIARMTLHGNWESLATQARTTDNQNFGGTHAFFFDTTKVIQFDGLVDTEYIPEKRQTTVKIVGEHHGIS
jgi:hypothetical protein